MRVCALIPVYNEASHIREVVKGCLKYVEAVFVVDDGSADDSAQLAREAGAVVLRHPRNLGKGIALKTGFREILRDATWDGVVVLDGDGQHNPDEIPKFLSSMKQGSYDIVVGNRMKDVRSMPIERTTTNYLSSRILTALTGQKIRDSQCGFRLVKTSVLREVVLKTRKYDTESEMLVEAARKRFRVGNVPIQTIYAGQKSNIHPVLDTLRFVRLAIGFLFQSKGGKPMARERKGGNAHARR
jgi:glycosyltransferase involved in cell wall biosynthesis